MMRNKKAIHMLLAATLCAGLCACGKTNSASPASASGDSAAVSSNAGKAGNVPTIRFATMQSKAASQLDWIKNWADSNKDIVNLELEVENGNDLRTKLTTDMASDNLPDMWTYWSKGSLQQYTDNDLLLPIDDYLAESKTITRDDYPASGWDGMTLNGTCYGVPYQGSTVVWFANQDLFDQYGLEIPKTYEDLLACAEVFSANDIVTLGVGSKHGDGIYVTFSQIFYQYEDTDALYSAVNDKDAFSGSVGVQKACYYINEMAQKNVFPKDTLANGSWDPCVSLYNNGKCAILPNMTWSAGNVSDDINSIAVDCVKFPGAVNDPSTFTCGGTNNGVVINKKSWEDPEKHDALLAFADAYFSDDCEKLQFKDGYNSCAKLTVEKLEEYTQGAGKIFYDAESSYENAYTLVWNFFSRINPREVFMDNLDALQAQSISPDEFIATVQSAINESLEE